MKLKFKRRYLVTGIVLAIVASFSMLTVTGILALATTQTLSVMGPQGTVSVTLSTSNVNYIYPLSSTARGYTYKWEMTARNTGTLAWGGSEVTVRVGVKGSSVVTSSTAGIGGTYQVEQCASGTDVVACREDLTASGWNLQYYVGSCSTTGTWLNADAPNRMGAVVPGALSPGQSKTMCFKMTVPASAADGNYPLVSNLLAYAGGTYAVSSKVDNIAVGGISGDLTMAMVGLLSIIGSIGALAVGKI